MNNLSNLTIRRIKDNRKIILFRIKGRVGLLDGVQATQERENCVCEDLGRG